MPDLPIRTFTVEVLKSQGGRLGLRIAENQEGWPRPMFMEYWGSNQQALDKYDEVTHNIHVQFNDLKK